MSAWQCEYEMRDGTRLLSPLLADEEAAETWRQSKLAEVEVRRARLLKLSTKGRNTSCSPASDWTNRFGYRWRRVEARLTPSGSALRITDWLTGKPRVKVYDVERKERHVELAGEDGAVHVVTAGSCSCKDFQFNGRDVACRHLSACLDVGLFQRQAVEA